MDEILLHKTQKLSTARKSPKHLDTDYDENDLFQVERISFEETKTIILNGVSMHLNANRTVHVGLKI